MNIKITNACGRFNTGCKLNLSDIYENNQFIQFSSKTYNRKRFSALICKVCESSMTLLIFSSGVTVVVGSKSRKAIRDVAEDFVFCLIMLMNYNAKVLDFRITNLCFSTEFGQNIDFTLFAKEDKGLSYEVEIFVNAKYKQNGYVFTITHKGKVYACGFKKKKHIIRETKILFEKLKKYIKINNNNNIQMIDANNA